MNRYSRTKLVEVVRIELTASCLQHRRSPNMSYTPTKNWWLSLALNGRLLVNHYAWTTTTTKIFEMPSYRNLSASYWTSHWAWLARKEDLSPISIQD